MRPSREPFALERTPDAEVARRVGVSLDAVQLVRGAEVIDLHLETSIPPRLFGYDLFRRHDRHWLGGRFFGHLDFPRALDGGLTGAMWSIATNIARGAEGRWRALRANVERLRGAIEATDGAMEVVRTAGELRAARARGAHAAMICVQGGNAYEASPGPAALEDVVRVTVVHLSDSCYGRTSSPLGFTSAEGLTEAGRAFVEQLDEARVFVDLAHVDRKGFWDAVAVHDRSLPLIDTHTGVCGVKEHWRNLDDAQIRAIADSGGVVGIIFEPSFLRPRGAPSDGRLVLRHLEHAIDVAGEDAVALGSDYDGAIRPPKDLRDGFAAYYRLVQYMLEDGWSEARIRKVLGESFLACFERLRPGAPAGA
ncbi:MAG TPA: membrane dipeptidase [Sandaracinaceae bacterium LLY-WYZ-13_1]|nr:membrane dipeptidase [Sandaracinaceae bacterium LLY-WYZ-13_1]